MGENLLKKMEIQWKITEVDPKKKKEGQNREGKSARICDVDILQEGMSFQSSPSKLCDGRGSSGLQPPILRQGTERTHSIKPSTKLLDLEKSQQGRPFLDEADVGAPTTSQFGLHHTKQIAPKGQKAMLESPTKLIMPFWEWTKGNDKDC